MPPDREGSATEGAGAAEMQAVEPRADRPPASTRAASVLGLTLRVRQAGLLAAIALVVIVVGVQEPRFLEGGNVEEILLSVAILAIVATGQTVVVLTRNIDLSVGSMVGLSAFVAGDLLKRNPGLSVVAVVGLVCALGLVMGTVNGALVTLGRVPSIVATLGTLYVFRGIAFAIGGSTEVTAGDLPSGFTDIATSRVLGVPILIVLMVAVVAVFAYLLRFTRWGRQLYALGSNPEAARLSGIRSDRAVFGAFVILGLLCGLAGVLWSARFAGATARTATGFELQVIAAVVVGGVNVLGGSGTVVGAALGALLLGAVQNGLLLLRVSSFWLQAVYGAVILVAVTLDALLTRRLDFRRATPRGGAP
jgi:rhamnose transport system permease protein